MMRNNSRVVAAVLPSVLFLGSFALSGSQTMTAAPALSQPDVQATLKQYCITCHNQRAKTANLELDTKDLDHLEKDVVAWEAVVRKLRTGMMPPKNASRPDRATLDGVAAWLETGLDRAAALHPNPGSPSLHRMNRNEYANAIRDLLDLQVDVTTLLPSDSIERGLRQHLGHPWNVAVIDSGLFVCSNEDKPSCRRRYVGCVNACDLSRAERLIAAQPPGRHAARHTGRNDRAPQFSAGCGIRDTRRRRPRRFDHRRQTRFCDGPWRAPGHTGGAAHDRSRSGSRGGNSHSR